jgi:hypothetical protein
MMSTNNLRSSTAMSHRNNPAPPLPLVVALNCIEDCALEQDSLAGVAGVEHVPLGRLAEGKIESAAAVLLHSLAYLPRAAQRRLRPYQLILCLGSADRSVDLLRRTHLLSRQTLSASGWLGSVQPLCRGMRRCRGLVLGIVGRSASARSLATRSLAFKMSVLYFDVHEVRICLHSVIFTIVIQFCSNNINIAFFFIFYKSWFWMSSCSLDCAFFWCL